MREVVTERLILINRLELQAYEAEGEPSDVRWEQAELVAAEVEETSTRKVAKGWLNPKTGNPYSHKHVHRVARAWAAWGVAYRPQERPRWYDAYNSPEVRGKSDAENLVASDENEWYTPVEYIEAARDILGGIDLDPASSAIANETVGAAKFYTVEEDGLSLPWSGRVWLNPPYGGLASEFTERLVLEYQAGEVTRAVALVNAHCTDTKWFQRLFDYPVCFTRGRIDFNSAGREKATTSTHGSAFVYLGEYPIEFAKRFSEFGTTVVRIV